MSIRLYSPMALQLPIQGTFEKMIHYIDASQGRLLPRFSRSISTKNELNVKTENATEHPVKSITDQLPQSTPLNFVILAQIAKFGGNHIKRGR